MSAATVPVPLLSKLPDARRLESADTVEPIGPVSQISVVGQLQVERNQAGHLDPVCPAMVRGRFGRFSVDGDGAWTYSLDRTAPQVQALGPGECMIDDCTVHDLEGHRHIIAVTILGSARGLPIRFIGDECRVSTEFDPVDELVPVIRKGLDRPRPTLPAAPDLPAAERWQPDPGNSAPAAASRVSAR